MNKITQVFISGFFALTLSGCAQLAPLVSGEVFLDSDLVEKTIEDGVLEQSGFYVVAECPDPMSGQVGDSRQCILTDELGSIYFVEVRIQNRDGFITWQVQE